ncbi:RNA polymerase sigma factor [Hyphobacterium sp.]|uniref:RNA polymerase sigma factor n=1 Tax=Hyphobacterium sp. TaxID=2004662 RepID=UPI003BA97AD2
MPNAERIYDELLLIHARAGDMRAAERLAVRWYPRLLQSAQRMLHDVEMAEEAVQEAWAGICGGWIGLNDPSRFPAWAYGILSRKCIDRLRKHIRDRSRTAELEAETVPAGTSVGDDRAALNQAFAALPDTQRITATLYFGEQLSLSEIASATGVPVGTVKSRLFKARSALKHSLGKETHNE